ncbi:MAG TPA: hypothetical protein PLQ35_15295 [bacterium]|nr:hypothetical protein [bacterium]HQL63649.1 hypothetical protein [bacterium]
MSSRNALSLTRMAVFFVAFGILCVIGCAQTQTADNRTTSESALFQLREMDMHLHAGMERPVPLDEWVELAAADGRKALLLLDHIELYRKTQAEYEAWAGENGFPLWYPVGSAGHKALMADFDRVAKKRKSDLLIFKGWEIDSRELDGDLETEPMRMADVLGWHISPNNGGEAPDGQLLIKRAKQLKALQKRFPVPMILCHPFSMRIENIVNTAQKQGRDISTITVQEYRFFQPGEQAQLAEILRGTSIYVEINRAYEGCWKNPVVREAFIADIRPLAEAGVQFTIGTDHHGLREARLPFHPEEYCGELGVTPENANGIIRDLLLKR